MNGSREMADAAEKKDSGQSMGFLEAAFRSGISAAEDIQKRSFDIPLNMLEGMGAPEDKIEGLRSMIQSMTGELYGAINSVADQVTGKSEQVTDKSDQE
jgi:hypothetical protein